MELLGEKGTSGVCRLRGEPRGVVSVEVTGYYCVGKGVEVLELECETGVGGGCWWNVDVDDVELLFV